MSLAKLTSLSTQTLSLLLERQRIQTLPSFTSGGTTNLHLSQITRNLNQLRSGILALETNENGKHDEAVKLLKNQYERMRGMLGPDGEEIESLAPQNSAAKELSQPAHSAQTLTVHDRSQSPSIFTPYTDEPDTGALDNGQILEQQKQLMDDQDERLETLSRSISRQHHISLQINDELDVHHGLLQQLDEDLDETEGRLGSARRRLDKFSRKARENASTVTIGVLIFVLLILIIAFKT